MAAAVSEFRSKLIVDASGGLPYTLFATLVYYSALLGRAITVPVGFHTDLASIPRVLWNILPPFGAYSAAAVIHDYLYQFNGVTRAQADAVLREAMDVCNVGRFTRWTIYAGVRAGGWAPWKRYRSSEQEQL